ncbi:asparagine synthase-related protein [Photorhabdus laumondii]|uniref:asparagine synthase-related protein n=1 Tax=Photorhabdus laumondii TaxID=2218628 RepID=UPI003315B04B
MSLNKNKSFWIVTNLENQNNDTYVRNVKNFYENLSDSHDFIKYEEQNHCYIAISSKIKPLISYINNKKIILDGWIKEESLNSIITSKENNEIYGEFSLAYFNNEGLNFFTDFYSSIPIYYFQNKNHYIITNDIRAIIVYSEFTVDVNFESVLYHLGNDIAIGENELPDNNTFFMKIKKVPKGSKLTIKNNKLSIKEIIDYNFEIDTSKFIKKDFISQFKEKFKESTIDRMNNGLTAIHFSGGLDSGSILATAIENDLNYLCVNIGFKNNDLMYSQDSEIVKKVSKRLDKPSYILWADNTLRFQNNLIDNDPLLYIDGPEPRSNSLACLQVDQLINELGAVQAITGESGDVILGEQFDEVILDSLIKFDSAKNAFNLFKIINEQQRVSPYNIKYYINLYNLFLSKFNNKLAKRTYVKTQWKDEIVKAPEYICQSKNFSTNKLYSDQYKNMLDGHRFMLDFLWPKAKYFDSLSLNSPMTHPFLDLRLVNLVFKIPPHEHLYIESIKYGSYFSSKRLARESFKQTLPEIFKFKKEKTSYEGMTKKILLNSKPGLNELFLSFDSCLVYKMGLVDRKKFIEALTIYLLKAEDGNSTFDENYQFIHSVITLEIWLRNITMEKNKLIERIKPRKINMKIDVEKIN